MSAEAWTPGAAVGRQTRQGRRKNQHNRSLCRLKSQHCCDPLVANKTLTLFNIHRVGLCFYRHIDSFSHPGGLKFGFFSELWCGGVNSPGEEILSEPNKEFELTSVISVSQAPSIFKNLVIWLQGDYQWLQSNRSWTDLDQFVWQTRVHVEGSVNVPQTWEKYSMASKMLTCSQCCDSQ